jgi:hypothetical protein
MGKLLSHLAFLSKELGNHAHLIPIRIVTHCDNLQKTSLFSNAFKILCSLYHIGTYVFMNRTNSP